MNTSMTKLGSRRGMLGVTLLELMAVVLVVGVLGAIAVPSYRQYVMRAQRTEAKSALLQLQTNQERFYLANRTYSDDPAALGFDGGLTERGTYTITIEDADTDGYTATATPTDDADINMTADEKCQTFSLTAQGVRTATGDDADNCW